MTNTPNSTSTEQKPASPANPQQTQGNPQQDNQGGNKPGADKPASQPQQK